MSLDKSIQHGKEQELKDFNCKWRDDFTWICFNGESEMCADVADDEYCKECKFYEEKNDGICKSSTTL